MPTEIILQHGWGFDSGTWSQWMEPLMSRGATVIVGERGYFGEATICPMFGGTAASKILVVHSLGLHLTPAETLKVADAVMLIGSFLRFHPDEPGPQRRSRRAIKSMLERLQTEPQAMLTQFARNCYAPEFNDLPFAYTCDDLNRERLDQDLRLLDENIIDAASLAGKTIITLHGDGDQIVAAESAACLAASLPQCEHHILAGAGHALPLTRAQACLQFLSSMVSLRSARELCLSNK